MSSQGHLSHVDYHQDLHHPIELVKRIHIHFHIPMHNLTNIPSNMRLQRQPPMLLRQVLLRSEQVPTVQPAEDGEEERAGASVSASHRYGDYLWSSFVLQPGGVFERGFGSGILLCLLS